MVNIVIMAGGGGSRLWPLSRVGKPKQFLDLGSGKTLIENTYERALAVGKAESIYVATTRDYSKKVCELLPDVPNERIFYEPVRRDTGPAFAAVGLALIDRGVGEEATIFMWSDHVFTNEEEFIGDMKKIPRVLRDYQDAIVIVGHTPTFAETGLGYLECGDSVKGYTDVYKVRAFKEKPDSRTAEEYVAAGNYYWNMAYVSVRPSVLVERLREYEPEMMEKVERFVREYSTGNIKDADEIYASVDPISIDYALLERAPNILAVTGDYGWSDVGNWAAVKEVFGTKGDHVPKGHHIHVDSANNFVYNATNKVVSLIGVKDNIIVVTDDAVLVTHKDYCHKVKDVVQKLEDEEKKEYL